MKNKYFRYNKQNKTLLSGENCDFEALGQVILLLGIGQYHLPSGFINHDIAQKEVRVLFCNCKRDCSHLINTVFFVTV